MLVFFTKVSLMDFQDRYLILFCLFLVTDGFGWFWMISLHKNIQLMLEFLKTPFLILHIYCCSVMSFLMVLFVILLSILIILSNLWSGIWSVATTRISFWTWIWSTKHSRLKQEVACWIQCWKDSTGFVWLVWSHWYYWYKNGWVCSWRKNVF